MMTRRFWRRQLYAYRFLAPTLVVVGAVLVYPLLYVFRLSFFSYSLGRGLNFIGGRTTLPSPETRCSTLP